MKIYADPSSREFYGVYGFDGLNTGVEGSNPAPDMVIYPHVSVL
jgi:hypothetical protein